MTGREENEGMPTRAEQERKAPDAARAALDRVYGPQGHEAGPEAADRIEGVLLLASWFRRYPEERQRVLPPARARALCPA